MARKTSELPEAVQDPIDLKDPALYVNRELSNLQFQYRVLEEARDDTNPLLERIRFLAIVAGNLDEFFMVRIAGLLHHIQAGVVEPPADGMLPAELLAACNKVTLKLMKEMRACLNELLLLLREAGIRLLDYETLSNMQRSHVQKYFAENVQPVLTPLAFDSGRPFPHISNLSLNLAVVVRAIDGQEHLAHIKVPSTLPRLVPINRSSGGVRKNGTTGRTGPYEHTFVWLEQVISGNLESLFPGMEIVEAHPFHLTRAADLEIQELEASDLLESVEQTVSLRRFGTALRVTVSEAMPKHIRALLSERLSLDSNNMFALNGPLGLSSLLTLYSIDRPDLKEPAFIPQIPSALTAKVSDGNIFAAIRREDILLHHPYDSFSPVVEFLRAAANDPKVLAIKQTLYRVGQNSPIVQALLDAREQGKQVAVLVELMARFDEESNIGWARTLEQKGVHVIYGLVGLKIHAKVLLVVRKEGNGIRRYVHISSGNYNAVTAQLYEDLGLFTCDEQIGADASDLFNFITGYSAKKDYNKLFVAPVSMRAHIEALIHREIDKQRRGERGRLIFKMNALVDRRMIQLLYAASEVGVQVDLLVRGICCLRPGIAGVSDNIRVLSIVGRFLEHSRIYYFRNGGAEEVFLGSADLMPRNLNRRVEVLYPVEKPALVRYLCDEVLATYLSDNVKARKMTADGDYFRRAAKSESERISSQEWFMQQRRDTQKLAL